MKKLNFLLICIMGLSMLSCSSDSENLADDNQNGGGNGKYVKKVIDDDKIREYTYNADKTLQRIISTNLSTGLISERLYFYDSNGLIREEYLVNSGGSSYSEEVQYHYENGQLVKASYFVGDTFCCEDVFTILNGRITSLTQYNGEGGELLQKSFTYDQNGNIISTGYNYSNGEQDQIVTFTYDNMRNGSWSFTQVRGFNHRRDLSGGFSVNRNNPISVKAVRQSDDTILEERSWSYAYDNEGFPITVNTMSGNEAITTTTIQYY